ncbi:MAG: YraN family protein [Actinomycetota bacterium]|nr:YraN family protein [Actinomycetota bacterium]
MSKSDEVKKKPDPRRTTGQTAEDICARRLRQKGWQILARNWRIRLGELDLVARTGNVLVVVEVKAIHTGGRVGPAVPALAVGPNKQRRIRKLASAWISTHGRTVSFREVRFDVIGILFERDGTIVTYDHIENAF